MKASIIIPTYCRPQQVHDYTARLLDTVSHLDTEIIVVAEVNDDALSLVEKLPVITTFHKDWRGSMANWNIGAGMATGDILVLWADDLWPLDGWLDNALAFMDAQGTCYCGLNDMLACTHPDCDPTHWVITRQGIIDHCGGCIMPPVYTMTFGDNEIAARMRRAGQFAWCAEAMVDHRHASAGKAKVDRAYLNMQRYLHRDQITFEARKAAGFPDDYPAVVFPLEADHAP